MWRSKTTAQTIRALLIIIALFACGCEPSKPARPAGDSPKTATPKRIITLSPAIAEIVFEIGAGDSVVGVSDYTVYPEDATGLPSLGGVTNVRYEKITSLKPDLVLLQGKSADALKRLGELGIRAETIDLSSLESIPAAMIRIGEILGKPEEAKKSARKLTEKIKNVENRTAGLPIKKVLIVTWRKAERLAQIGTVGKGEFLDRAVAAAGGKNIYNDCDVPYPSASLEFVAKAAPDVILELRPGENLTKEQKKDIADDWNEMAYLPAVKNGQVHVLDQEFLMLAGPRIADTVEVLAKIIHPGSAKDE